MLCQNDDTVSCSTWNEWVDVYNVNSAKSTSRVACKQSVVFQIILSLLYTTVLCILFLLTDHWACSAESSLVKPCKQTRHLHGLNYCGALKYLSQRRLNKPLIKHNIASPLINTLKQANTIQLPPGLRSTLGAGPVLQRHTEPMTISNWPIFHIKCTALTQV